MSSFSLPECVHALARLFARRPNDNVADLYLSHLALLLRSEGEEPGHSLVQAFREQFLPAYTARIDALFKLEACAEPARARDEQNICLLHLYLLCTAAEPRDLADLVEVVLFACYTVTREEVPLDLFFPELELVTIMAYLYGPVHQFAFEHAEVLVALATHRLDRKLGLAAPTAQYTQ